MLCFTGNFDFSPVEKTIISQNEQTVTGVTSRKGDCKHTITIQIHHPDGTMDELPALASDSTTPVQMKFKKGDRLEVFMQPTSKECDANLRRDMWNSNFAMILPNECRTGGK